MKKLSYAALLLVAATLLGATVLREPVADAASATLNVLVTNDSAHPVPVHEQGTANVNVTNGSLTVAPPAPQGDVVQVDKQLSFPASGDSKFDRVTLYTVPQGKRFVASFGSVSGEGGPTGFTTADISVAGEFSLDLVGEHFRVADDAQGFTAGGPITFYAGPGDTIEGLAQRGGISRDVVFEFMLVGHLEDLPS
jgi:hypothetical protein